MTYPINVLSIIWDLDIKQPPKLLYSDYYPLEDMKSKFTDNIINNKIIGIDNKIIGIDNRIIVIKNKNCRGSW